MEHRQEPEEFRYGFTVTAEGSGDGTALEEKLTALPGVLEAEVSRQQGRVWVRGSGIARTVLEEAIAQSGYEVTGCTSETGRE